MFHETKETRNCYSKISKKGNPASLNFHDSPSTALIDDYHETVLNIINC